MTFSTVYFKRQSSGKAVLRYHAWWVVWFYVYTKVGILEKPDNSTQNSQNYRSHFEKKKYGQKAFVIKLQMSNITDGHDFQTTEGDGIYFQREKDSVTA